MFKWLTEKAEYKLWFKVSLSRFALDFKLEIYNIDLSFYVPFPYFNCNWFKSLYNITILSPFTYRYKKNDDCRRRWLEFDSYIDNSLDTGLEISIPHYPRDHDDRVLSMNVLGLGICITTYHSYHICSCKNGIDRFPTPEECIAFKEYKDKLIKKMFEGKFPSQQECLRDKKLKNKVMKYHKLVEYYYNNIPVNDKTKE